VWIRTERMSPVRGAAAYGLPLAVLGGAAGWAAGHAMERDTMCPLAPGASCSGGVQGAQRVVGALGAAAFGGLGALYGATHGRLGWTVVGNRSGARLIATPTRVGIAIPLR
jgi:hypothetical protein